MCCKPEDKARNAAISGAFFGILTIICAAIAAATPQFTLATFLTPSTTTGLIDFGLTFVRVTDVLNNGALSSVSTYPGFIAANCGGLCPSDFQTATGVQTVRLRAALQSAAGAGSAAVIAYIAAIVSLLLQVIGAIFFACGAGGRSCSAPFPALFASQTAGVIVACTAFLSLVIAASIGLGVFSGVAAAGLAYLPFSNVIWLTAVW
jgi:hypothetical protein